MAPVKKRGRGGLRLGSGRKPIRPEERRRNRVVLNLTDQELAQLEKAAKAERASDFARRIIFRSLARRRK